MKIKSVRQIKNLKGKRVLLRVDFNVPVGADFKIDQNEDYRLVQTLPTINYLKQRGAKIIIVAHLGRPDGRVVEKLRLDPVAIRLAQLINQEIFKSDEIIGPVVKQKIEEMRGGEIMMLENIRFHPREEAGCRRLARQLASLADYYVNDAFAASHRRHASVATIQDFLPSFAGFLLEREIIILSRIFKKPKKPLVIIIGGAKISTKLKLITRFTPIADQILLGGALANTVFSALGVAVGQSIVEPKMFKSLRRIKLTDNQLRLPIDGLFAKNYQARTGRIDALADIRSNEVILDIGPETAKLYGKIIKQAKMVVWNGPMGLIETPFFAQGTKAVIRAVAQSRAESIVGGGETVQLIRQMKMADKFSFVSTGGGAMLEFLEGKNLPGLRKIIID